MKRAYQEDHQFDEDAMPCICFVCNGWFDLTDGAPNPRKDNEIICEGCADDIQKELDKEEEIEDLLSQISDAEYTIKDCRERLLQLNYKAGITNSVCAKCGGVGSYQPSKSFSDRVICECSQIVIK